MSVFYNAVHSASSKNPLTKLTELAEPAALRWFIDKKWFSMQYNVHLNVRNMSQKSLQLIILIFYYPDIDVVKLTIKLRFEVWVAVQLKIQVLGSDIVMVS
jgi:hypothetical protein